MSAAKLLNPVLFPGRGGGRPIGRPRGRSVAFRTATFMCLPNF